MAHTPQTVPFNIPIERITPGYLQVVIQLSIINLQIALEHDIYLLHRSSPRVINGIILHFTAFQHFHKFCTMGSVVDKISFLTTSVIFSVKFLLALADLKVGT